MSTRKAIVEAVRLTTAQFHELSKAATDVFFFSQFCKVINAGDRNKPPVIPFLLYPYQKATLLQFIKHRFNVILKFRQAGVTELISMYCLWLAMYHPHKNIIIISIKDRVAKKVLRKIKFMYKNLPDHLKVKVVNGRGTDIGTSTELEFVNGSLIASIPTTEDAGRSEAVSLLVIDEAAIVRWAERIWAASFPTLSTGGSAIINSTAYGIGNFFHSLFVNAVAGGNVFNAIRLHWQMHPDRDYTWYKQQLEILGPRKTAQEIDGDFLTSGNTVFDLSDIRDIEDYIDEEVEVIETRHNGMLQIYERPKKGLIYTIGADVATGRANDYSAFTLMDQYGDEKVSFKGKIGVTQYRYLLGDLGMDYGKATIAPESNDIGLAVASGLQEDGYSKLYYSKSLLRKKGKRKPEVQEIPGWYTTKANRPIIINELEEDVRQSNINLKDKRFCEETPTFIYDNRNRPVAMNKDKTSSDDPLADDNIYTDDSIFGKAICNHVRKGKVQNHVILPR